MGHQGVIHQAKVHRAVSLTLPLAFDLFFDLDPIFGFVFGIVSRPQFFENAGRRSDNGLILAGLDRKL